MVDVNYKGATPPPLTAPLSSPWPLPLIKEDSKHRGDEGVGGVYEDIREWGFGLREGGCWASGLGTAGGSCHSVVPLGTHTPQGTIQQHTHQHIHTLCAHQIYIDYSHCTHTNSFTSCLCFSPPPYIYNTLTCNLQLNTLNSFFSKLYSIVSKFNLWLFVLTIHCYICVLLPFHSLTNKVFINIMYCLQDT
jgi:hypothetical protein